MIGLLSHAGARLPHRPRAIAALVFAIAFGVRLLYLAAFRGSPFYDQLIVDAQWHDAWAWDWARGLPSAESGAFFRAPLYPLWLSFLYRCFGHDLDAVRLVQAILGSVTAGCLAYAGAVWFGRRAGLAAGLLAALYGTFVHYDAELLIPNLLLVFLAGSLAALASGNIAVAGALIGLAGIARPNALVLVPLVAWFAWRYARRRVVATGLTLVLGSGPALAVTAVNAERESAHAGVATQGGLNFYAGNHAGATGKSLEIQDLSNLITWRELVPRAEEIAQEKMGRDLDSAEVSGWWFRRGLAWIGAHPGDAIELYVRKLYYLMNAYETPSDRDLYVHARGILRGLLWTVPGLAVPWGVVFPLAVIGFLAHRAHAGLGGRVRYLGAWVGLYAASILPFFVTGRFRLGLVPPILLLAGLALSRPRETFRGRPLAVGVGVFLVANSAFLGAREVNLAAEESRHGDVLLREGRTQEGLSALERSFDLDSTRTVTAYMLARGHLEAGAPRRALPYFERVFAARPEDAEVSFGLGTALLAAGDVERAVWILERSASLDSTNVAAWINLGVAYEEQGRTDWSLAAYRRGLSIDPGAETGVVRATGLLLEEHRAAEAAPLLEAALRHRPHSFDVHFALAVTRATLGDTLGARGALEEALRLRPGDPRAVALGKTLQPGSGAAP